MPDAMMNGGFAPYLAQAFTPQGVAGGLFGSGIGNVPGNMFSNPAFAQSYTPGGVPGGVPPFTVTPQLGQPYAQAYPGWQQQVPQFVPGWALGQVQPWQNIGQIGTPQLGQSLIRPYTGWQQQLPQFPQSNPFGQIAGLGGVGLNWPYGQVLPWQNVGQIGTHQLGQSFAQPSAGWHEPLLLAQLLRQYAVPISAVMASPYGQAHIAQHIVQTAEMLTRVLPLVGAPQLIPLAHLLGQYAVPISAAIASPFGQAHIAQNIAQTAEMLARILPVAGAQQLNQPYNSGWQQQLVPQLPVASLLGQQQQYLPQQAALAPFGGIIGGQFGSGQPGPFSAPSGDMLGRILPFLAQQGLAGQAYGMARI